MHTHATGEWGEQKQLIHKYQILENSEYNILMMQLNMLVQATKFFGFAWTRAKQARFTCSPKHMACYTNHTGLCRATTHPRGRWQTVNVAKWDLAKKADMLSAPSSPQISSQAYAQWVSRAHQWALEKEQEDISKKSTSQQAEHTAEHQVHF